MSKPHLSELANNILNYLNNIFNDESFKKLSPEGWTMEFDMRDKGFAKEFKGAKTEQVFSALQELDNFGYFTIKIYINNPFAAIVSQKDEELEV